MKLLVTVAIAALAAACGGDNSDNNDNADNPSKSKSATPGKGGVAATRTSVPMNPVRVAAVATTAVPGYTQASKSVRGSLASVQYRADKPNASGKTVSLMVIVQPCVMCQPLDLAKWRANDNLKMMLPKVHKDNPALVWEVEALEAGGVRGIYSYSLSYHKSEDGRSTSTSHTVTLFFNNGTNQMSVMVSARGVNATSLQQLRSVVTKDDLVTGARVALAAFGPKL